MYILLGRMMLRSFFRRLAWQFTILWAYALQILSVPGNELKELPTGKFNWCILKVEKKKEQISQFFHTIYAITSSSIFVLLFIHLFSGMSFVVLGSI